MRAEESYDLPAHTVPTMNHSGSQSKLKGSLESGRNAAYSHLQAREHSTVRVDIEFDAYSLRQMNQTRTPASIDIWKKTKAFCQARLAGGGACSMVRPGGMAEGVSCH